MWHVLGRRDVHVKFWVGNVEERDQDVKEETVLRVGLEEIRRKGVEWTELAQGRG